jgi:hypothetical protein
LSPAKEDPFACNQSDKWQKFNLIDTTHLSMESKNYNNDINFNFYQVEGTMKNSNGTQEKQQTMALN